jgi:hypothetical protein
MAICRFILFFILLLFALLACRKSDYETNEGPISIRDNGSGTGTTTWTSENSYLLEGFVFVNDGQVLTIEPGTVIRSKTGQGSAATALIVARGGRIHAEGTSSAPIVFTVEGDDLQGSVPMEARGLWGGIILLGRARLNLSSFEAHIEGIPLTEPRAVYGGFNDEDNSGILRYVSIRHGGTNIGEGNEINGLTLGAVGNKTIIDHVEIISNADDGIECFGGNARCKYMVIAFCGDDGFDYDIGYRGFGQFWLVVQQNTDGDRLIEGGGGIYPVTGKPYSVPVIFNGTYLGRGENAEYEVCQINNNGGGIFANSIFLNQGSGFYIEYVQDGIDSYHQFEIENLQIRNNVFYEVAENIEEDVFNVFAVDGVNDSSQNDIFKSYFEEANNIIADPGIIYEDGSLDPIPGQNVFNNLADYPDPWFEQVNYKGAFYTYNWASGWTLLSQSGYLKD